MTYQKFLKFIKYIAFLCFDFFLPTLILCIIDKIKRLHSFYLHRRVGRTDVQMYCSYRVAK